MPRASNQVEPNLPWVESAEDKRFRRLTIIFLVLFMGLGIVLNMIELPEPEQRNLVDVSPRLAKLILEKKKEPPPKPEVEKPQVEKKEEEKPKPKPTAREIAKSSGLLAAADELADLRDSFDLDEALEDSAYSSEDTYIGPGGLTWLHRWAITRDVDRSLFQGEPTTASWVQEVAGIQE